MFSASCWRATAVLMPTSRPARSTSGPPEFPGLIAASVCSSPSQPRRARRLDRPVEPGHDAARDGRAAEIERVADRDDGVAEPQRCRATEPDRHEVRRLTRMTARSRSGATPITSPRNVRRGRVVERDVHARRPLDDVVVRDDDAARGRARRRSPRRYRRRSSSSARSPPTAASARPCPRSTGPAAARLGGLLDRRDGDRLGAWRPRSSARRRRGCSRPARARAPARRSARVTATAGRRAPPRAWPRAGRWRRRRRRSASPPAASRSC